MGWTSRQLSGLLLDSRTPLSQLFCKSFCKRALQKCDQAERVSPGMGGPRGSIYHRRGHSVRL